MLASRLVYYRSSASGVDDSTPTDSEELVKDCPTGCAPIVKKQRVFAESPSYFSTADVDAALQLMGHQGLTELQNADWLAFIVKKAQLATSSDRRPEPSRKGHYPAARHQTG